MKKNLYPGRCARCGLLVKYQEGWLIQEGSHVKPIHFDCYEKRRRGV